MFWDKKSKEEGLPDLPSLPPLPNRELDSEIEKQTPRQILPSFPDSPMKRGFSQAAIKDAIAPEMPDTVNVALQPRAIEMDSDEQIPANMSDSEEELSSIPLFPTPKRASPLPAFQPQTQKNADIFIRIEKYHDAKKALKEIQVAMLDIDNVLKKIRETKLREEQELLGWEKEIEKTKARVKEVVENIFEKVD